MFKTYFLRKSIGMVQRIAYMLLFISSPVQANESFLPVQEVVVGLNNIQNQELKQYSIYQPSTTFLLMPIRKWIYQFGKSHFNPEKIKNDIVHIKRKYAHRIAQAVNEKERKMLVKKLDRLVQTKETMCTHGNFLMRIGEKPICYDPNFVHRNEKIFKNYLNSKGYLDAKVTSKTDVQKKKVRITYYIAQKNLYKISTTTLEINNKPIRDILLKHIEASFIKKGSPYQYQDFVNERERIITLLSNNGYFEFDEQHIYFTAEPSQADYTIAITTIIDGCASKADRSKSHTTYSKTKIGRIVVDLMCKNQEEDNDMRLQTKECQGICFRLQSNQYPLADLAGKIPIRVGDIYNKSKILETYERLYSINVFEFISISSKIEAGQLVVYIHVNPYERVSLQTEFGGEFVSLNLKNFHPMIKVRPTIRRLYGSLSIIDIEASIAWREQLVKKMIDDVCNHATYRLRFKFTIPRFQCCLPKKINQILENFSPSTTIDMGYSFMHNSIHSDQKIDGVLHYDWYNKGKNIVCQFLPFSMTFIYPKIIDVTKQNQIVTKLLSPSFFTSIGYTAIIRNAGTTAYMGMLDQHNWVVSIGLEYGGAYEYFFPIRKMLPKEFQFYTYLKFDLGYCHAFNLSKDVVLASQIKLGIIKAFKEVGASCLEQPIVHPDKQYEVGGHGGVRAWDTQMVGPGFYEPVGNKAVNRKGDLLLLGNVELRKKLIGYLEGALFLDVGNTWRLSNHEPAEMRFYFPNFYKALALGGGFGLRLNFYHSFVLCADIAFQLSRPSGLKLSRVQLAKISLGIGYPF